jgi:hypothetical protein
VRFHNAASSDGLSGRHHEEFEMRPIYLMALTAIVVAGCARRPDAIAPVSMPMEAYTSLSCNEMARELQAERGRLAALSETQNQAATGDAVGVFLIGIPTSTVFGGDKEGQLAASKGKVQAIEAAAMSKRCTVPGTGS